MVGEELGMRRVEDGMVLFLRGSGDHLRLKCHHLLMVQYDDLAEVSECALRECVPHILHGF